MIECLIVYTCNEVSQSTCVVDGSGLFMYPTIFTNVKDGMFIATEESFGPIMIISKFKQG